MLKLHLEPRESLIERGRAPYPLAPHVPPLASGTVEHMLPGGFPLSLIEDDAPDGYGHRRGPDELDIFVPEDLADRRPWHSCIRELGGGAFLIGPFPLTDYEPDKPEKRHAREMSEAIAMQVAHQSLMGPFEYWERVRTPFHFHEFYDDKPKRETLNKS